ncbi:MAG: DEAD/DEAH box helicase [Planctomycetota bacterium]|jgi:DEAD/DEAH box helicase domain-containing protein
MMIIEFIRQIKEDGDIQGVFAHHRVLPKRSAVTSPMPDTIPSHLEQALAAQGISELYLHQAEAFSRTQEGKNVIVTTPTASGKTLAYNLPVFQAVSENPDARALYIFPTKALEQDQKKSIEALASTAGGGLTVEVYDGDTTAYRRRKIKASPPHILITNPDMIHLGILAYHSAWEEFLKNLSFIVLDEIHTYKGVFGSHIVQVLRRLRRIASLYDASPRFIACSATIANASEFATALTGLPFEVVDQDTSPAAGRHFLFINPSGSPYTESARLFSKGIRAGLKAIAFTKARKITELMHAWVSRTLSRDRREKVSSYRAGFLPKERREIEGRLFSGELDGVISTSALEVGIDIGGLDLCILVGFPGTLINAWQRGGRVGRGDRESLVVLVAQPDALDQYFIRYPSEFFDRSFESAIVDPGNPHILKQHLQCAAAESPLVEGDEPFDEAALGEALRSLEMENLLVRSADGSRWFPVRSRPHRDVDIRAIGRHFPIFHVDTKKAIGSVSGMRALSECHEGAIYLHRAKQYVIQKLDLEEGNIWASPTKAQYFTKPVIEKETEILETFRQRPVMNFILKIGRVKVTETFVGFQKKNTFTQETLSQHPLDLPPQTFETVGVWLEIPPHAADVITDAGGHFMGGIHALEHAMIAVFPLFALCDRNDIGGISTTLHPQVKGPAIFLYDGTPGGVGLCERAYEVMETLLERTRRTVTECPCEEGCPSCIHSPRCGSGNKPLDKMACGQVLSILLHDAPPPPPAEVSAPPEPEPQPKIDRVDPTELLAAHRILIFDLETQRSAKDVGGWHNCHLMRVSVAVTYDTKEGVARSYWEKDVEELLASLREAELVVGFNVDRFDLGVLKGYSRPADIASIKTFDMLAEIKNQLGFRISLDDLAKETLGKGKTADGLQALEWFKEGELEKIREYCEKDVMITRDIFIHGLAEGFLLYQRKGEKVRLPLEWSLEEILGSSGSG